MTHSLIRHQEISQTSVRTNVPSSGALHFSTRGEYGVRLMVELARHYGSGPVSLSEMAEHESLPRPYLEQLVVSLREADLVTSTRGARGGYELTRSPAAIRMSEVITALEGPIAPMVCASDDPHHTEQCQRAGFCNVEQLWLRVRDAIVSALEFDDPRTTRRAAPRPPCPSPSGPHGRPTALRASHQGASRPTMTNDTATLPGTNAPGTAPGSAAGSTADPAVDDRVLTIRDLHVVPVASRDVEILRGIDLEIRKGEVHAIMGRNGSGKTTLAYALMGHPAYEVTSGEVIWKGIDVLSLSPDKRARLGLFLAFQYPTAVPGLSVASFLRTALNARRRGLDVSGNKIDPSDATRGGIKMGEFRNLMREKMNLLHLDDSFAGRYVNEGFSGGEKKRLEMLQMAILEPEFAILDETDSGLDIDALRIVAEGVNAQLNPDLGVLLITHYQRLLNYIKPDYVHVLAHGQIIASGGKELALRLEDEGYAPILAEAGFDIDTLDEDPEVERLEQQED